MQISSKENYLINLLFIKQFYNLSLIIVLRNNRVIHYFNNNLIYKFSHILYKKNMCEIKTESIIILLSKAIKTLLKEPLFYF